MLKIILCILYKCQEDNLKSEKETKPVPPFGCKKDMLAKYNGHNALIIENPVKTRDNNTSFNVNIEYIDKKGNLRSKTTKCAELKNKSVPVMRNAAGTRVDSWKNTRDHKEFSNLRRSSQNLRNYKKIAYV